MNKLTLFSLISLLFASCATTNDVVSDRWIQKRKYTNGYFVASNDKIEKQEVTPESQKEEASELEAAKRQPAVTTAQEIVSPPTRLEALAETPQLTASVASETPRQAPQTAADHASLEAPAMAKKQRAVEGFDSSVALETEFTSANDTDYLLMLILAILLPPLPIFIIFGLETEFWISLILTILMWLPGVIYAIIKVSQHYR